MTIAVVIVRYSRTAKPEHIRYETISDSESLMRSLARIQNGEFAWISETIINSFVANLVKQKRLSLHGDVYPGARINIGGHICYVKEQDVIEAIIVALTTEQEIKPIEVNWPLNEQMDINTTCQYSWLL